MARFEDHKAAVKTNQEYTALLHEITTFKTEKTAIEDKLLILMEQGDDLADQLKAAQSGATAEDAKAATARAALTTERQALEAYQTRLATERREAAAGVDARSIALYDQLLKGRRGVAVARMTGEICDACHVRSRTYEAMRGLNVTTMRIGLPRLTPSEWPNASGASSAWMSKRSSPSDSFWMRSTANVRTSPYSGTHARR